MGRWRLALGVGLVAALAACGGGSDDAATNHSSTTTTSMATQPGHATLAIRPVLAIVDPASSTLEATPPLPGTEILESISTTDTYRYQVGPAAVTGTAVKAARAEDLGASGWVVTVELTAEGSKRLNALAKDLYEKQPPENSIAIVVDGIVQTAPTIATPTLGDTSFQISGAYDRASAQGLATALNP